MLKCNKCNNKQLMIGIIGFTVKDNQKMGTMKSGKKYMNQRRKNVRNIKSNQSNCKIILKGYKLNILQYL